ncbi:hypothetical protein [Streptomyces chartreusis]|uniref:hypothetical protein n=1 Tax=Streptomyces chartreusis TaxID=1969 RepID=UPI0037B55C4C
MPVYERTGWGWLAWTVPDNGTQPGQPVQIGVLTPGATMMQRLTVRWLTRPPAHRIPLAAGSPASLRLSAVIVAAISLLAALYALNRAVPADLVLTAMLLAPLLAEYLPDWLDTRAVEHVRWVEDDAACQYLQRLAGLHTYLVEAAASCDRYELRRSAEIGHQLLWNAADLLQSENTRRVSARLIDQERLMVQLVDQVAQTLDRTRTTSSGQANHRSGGPLGPLPPGFEPVAHPTPQPAGEPSPRKGHQPMTQAPSGDSARTTDVYLLFAHEPYYPAEGTQEINTTLVAAASLLHPQVQQPDGIQIHNRLTQGREPGEIIPLATLTHELGGGTEWPYVGDWEKVTTDLVRLVRTGRCDALSLGLPELARALICTGPNSHVRTLDTAADQSFTYGPNERAAVLAEVDKFLASLVTEQDLWPGDGLLPPFQQP